MTSPCGAGVRGYDDGDAEKRMVDMPGNLKPLEILMILAVVLLLFGAKRLPDLAKSVGKSMRILKNEVKDLRDDDDAPARSAAPTVPVAPAAPPVQASAPSTPITDYLHPQSTDDSDRKRV